MSYSERRPSVIFRPRRRPPVTLYVRVARSPEQLAVGMMGVKNLPLDEGLLMIFPRSDRQALWMKNVPIPLDMIFIDQKETVVGVIESAVPYSTTSREIARWSRYVVEANGGFARENGIVLGTPTSMFVPTP